MIQPALLIDDIDDGVHVLGLKVILQLQHAGFFVLFADLDIFPQGGHNQILAALLAILIHQTDGAQGFIAGFFNDHFILGDALGIVVMEQDKLAVRGAMHVGFNAEIRTIARGNEGGIGVFKLQTAGAAMRYHAGLGISQMQCIFHGKGSFQYRLIRCDYSINLPICTGFRNISFYSVSTAPPRRRERSAA